MPSMKSLLRALSSVVVVVMSMPALAAGEFRIEFEWDKDMKTCSASESPEIKLFDVPEGTTELKVKMKDKQSAYRHGGGVVPYNGEGAIVAGALSSWEGPCPPSPHTYEFIVDAIASGKKSRYGEVLTEVSIKLTMSVALLDTRRRQREPMCS